MELAERIVDEGKADVVTMLRSTIADPQLVNKARLGKYNEIRPCVRCNTCINQPHYFFLPVRCAVNPEAGRECDVLRIPSPRKLKNIAVIGGGPSGMEAARTAAERGHKVTLYEKGIELGGMLNVAAAGSLKTDLRAYLNWAVRETVKNPITLRLGTTATYDMVKAQKPDAVIVSVGANPLIPPIPGINGKNSLWAGDVESGRATVGKKVIIAGGGLTGLETALTLSREGKEVTIVEMMPFERVIMSAPVVNMVALSMLIREQGIKYLAETRLLEVAENKVMVKDHNGIEKWMECDTLVHALGMTPDKAGALIFEDTADEVYYTGDCAVTRGNLWTATSSAHHIALEI
jgi:NADPH-dependent 2,4-dienoyl-CoA reductase/sulfur reductase-like enzyme